MYAVAFVVSNKTLSGSIQQYLTDTNQSRLQTWDTDASLTISVGTLPGPVWYFVVTMPSVVFTNRMDTQETFYQIYDFRMTSNPANLSTVLDYDF